MEANTLKISEYFSCNDLANISTTCRLGQSSVTKSEKIKNVQLVQPKHMREYLLKSGEMKNHQMIIKTNVPKNAILLDLSLMLMYFLRNFSPLFMIYSCQANVQACRIAIGM